MRAGVDGDEPAVKVDVKREVVVVVAADEVGLLVVTIGRVRLLPGREIFLAL